MDIVAFLTARLDERQAAAEAAQAVDPGPWSVSASDQGSTNERSGHGAALVIAADEVALWDCEGSNTLCMTAPTANHVASNDPARVLAHVKAMRQLLGLHGVETLSLPPSSYELPEGFAGEFMGYCQLCSDIDGTEGLNTYYEPWPCPSVCILANIDADHPDFNPAWAV